MSSITRNPTSNVTPDPGQGGGAVTGNINTGHGSTTVSRSGAGSDSDSCKWTAFPSIPGQKVAITIKADWTEDGNLSGVSPDNLFRIQYSLNGGAGWNTLKSTASITSPSSGSSSASLPTNQDTSQVQVRDLLQVTGGDPGDLEDITASVSNIRLEITLADGGLIIMM